MPKNSNIDQKPQCVQTDVIGSVGLNVISLFNGMSTGRQALYNLGILVNKYYSSELKPYAIELAQYHFPDTIQVGDVTKWREWDIDWKSIDLILSGSPCQDLSIAGNRAGLKGNKSSLFWVFIDILNHVKKNNPKVKFFQENVGSAPINDVRIMSEAMGVLPVRINSKLLTAQLRDRYYWSNIKTREDWTGYVYTDIPTPEDKKIMFKDILTDGFTDRKKARAILESESRLNKDLKKMKRRYEEKGFINIVYLDKYKDLVSVEDEKLKVKTNTTDGFQYATKEDCINLSFASSTTRRGRITKGKAPCLLQGNEPLFAFTGDNIRPLNKIELCRLQGFPDDYCDILTRNKAASLLGDGWTLPVVEHFFSYLR